jgi:predicted amidohydrolase/alkylhydroperoxidase/carboxymuconolactone decarboxylase family protein YurZ
MIVAAVQMQAMSLDVANNATRACSAVADAASRGAKLVVLPELISTGYVLEREAVARLAEPAAGDGPTLTAWRNAARTHATAIIGGYAERDGETLYNAVAVIDSHGTLVGGYRKLHLFGEEHDVFAPGNLGLPTFTLDGVNVGVLVCYDLRFPEAMRLQALAGAHLIAVPTAWVEGFDAAGEDSGRVEQLEGALTQANLNQVYVACADQVGETGDLRFLGRSVVVSPYGRAIAGPLSRDGEAIAVAELDIDETVRAQVRGDGISPRSDRRTDVYSLERATPRTRDPTALLAEMERKRGYVLELHRTLAARDPEFLEVYENLLDGAFLRERLLDRRTKELIYIGVLMALSTPREHLVAHMRAAVAHGASEEEVLEVLEQALAPCGVARFIEGMAAFEHAFGQSSADRSEC